MPRPEQHCAGVFLHVFEEGLSWCPRCGAIRFAGDKDWLLPSGAEKIRKPRAVK